MHLKGEQTVAALPFADGSAELTAPVRMQADVYRSEGELLAVIEASTRVAVACSRCLSPAQIPLQVRFTEVLRPGHEPAGADEADGDRHTTYYTGDEIDLLPLIEENLALALPMKPLCRHECRGLCPTCGHDLNLSDCDCAAGETDPRLARLGELWDKAQAARKGVE